MAKYILADDGRFHVKHELSDMTDVDELFEQAARLVIDAGAGSASLIQRRLEVGYARAARMLDQLEQAGIISASEGNKPREVIVSSFEDYLNNKGVDVGPEEVYPEDIKKEWEPTQIQDPLHATLQKEALNSKDVLIPIGTDKKRLVSKTLNEIGHVYVFNSPTCNSIGLLKSQLEFLACTYSPDVLKIIVSDDTRLFSTTTVAKAPHLLTPIIYERDKVRNALSWASAEVERRFRILEESGIDSYAAYAKTQNPALPRIVFVVSSVSNSLAYDEDSYYGIERLPSSGHFVGVHLIVASPLLERKFSKLMTSFPTKIIFKTFSTSQADLLGTDDAFELSSPDEFLFVPAYGKVEKLAVCR